MGRRDTLRQCLNYERLLQAKERAVACRFGPTCCRCEYTRLASHNDIANYVIYPRDTMDQYQATVITSLLHGLVADKTQIYCSDTAERTLFWAAPLSSANAQRVESDPNVRFWALIIHECALTDDFRSLLLSKSKNRRRTAMTLLIVDSES